MGYRILRGDCIDLMATLDECSVDAVVTDPPYGIGFMGKSWDHKDIMARVQKRAEYAQPPTKDGHERDKPRKAPAEEAGVYDLSPKGMKAFHEWTRAWAEQAIRALKPGGHLLSFASTRTYHRMACGIEEAGFEIRDQIGWLFGSGFPKSHNLKGGWEGWGSALKPAWEPVVVARKPLIGTIAENVAAYGTGAINIAACRVGCEQRINRPAGNKPSGNSLHMSVHGMPQDAVSKEAVGRWPANVVHDGSDEVLAAFPEAKGQQGNLIGHSSGRVSPNGIFGAMGPAHDALARNDSGSAARFFYCAKASRADRNAGLDNNHPTVKPTALMRYLCRLVTPLGGVVLDPFMGSGSTGRGAILEGFGFVGIEMDESYANIAQARIEDAVREAESMCAPEPQIDLFEQQA